VAFSIVGFMIMKHEIVIGLSMVVPDGSVGVVPEQLLLLSSND
jgi:hypothetical protein